MNSVSMPKDKTTKYIYYVVVMLVCVLVSLAPMVTVGILVLVVAGLLLTWVVVKRPFWIVLLLTIYLPFETICLNLLPPNSTIYLAAQFSSEIIIYYALIFQIIRKIICRKILTTTPIDRPLIGFIILAIATTLLNHTPILGSIVNLRALLRYVFLFYLVVNLDIKPQKAQLLLRIILIIGMIQIIVGAGQLLFGEAINKFLLPQAVNLEIAGQARNFRLLTGGREIGSIFGTLGDTVFFSLYMLLALALHLGRIKKLTPANSVITAIILIAGGYSYARATIFGMILTIITFHLIYDKTKKIYLIAITTLPIAVIGTFLLLNTVLASSEYVNPVQKEQSILANITGIFSKRYLEIARKQRLESLLNTAPTILLNHPFLGYGPDKKTAIEKLNHSYPTYLSRPLIDKGFEDVYWVALLTYYGTIGVGILIIILGILLSSAHKIYKSTDTQIIQTLAVAVTCLTSTTFFLLFFNQALEYRVYSYFFWLLPALMYKLYSQETIYNASNIATN